MSIAIVKGLEKKVARNTIETARESFGLSYSEIAKTLGVDRRTLLRYRKLLNVPSAKARMRMEKMREVDHLLSEVFKDGEAALEWLYSPVPMLRGKRAIDLIRRGELDEVVSVLAGLHSGAYA